MERDCCICIHRTGGKGCTNWKCEMETKDQFRDRIYKNAVEKFLDEIIEENAKMCEKNGDEGMFLSLFDIIEISNKVISNPKKE